MDGQPTRCVCLIFHLSSAYKMPCGVRTTFRKSCSMAKHKLTRWREEKKAHMAQRTEYEPITNEWRIRKKGACEGRRHIGKRIHSFLRRCSDLLFGAQSVNIRRVLINRCGALIWNNYLRYDLDTLTSNHSKSNKTRAFDRVARQNSIKTSLFGACHFLSARALTIHFLSDHYY